MEKITQILPAHDLHTHRPALELAAKMLRDGGLVAFATETVYGLGANALDPKAVAGIFTAKGRPQDNPLIVHITSMEELAPLVREIPHAAQALADRFWPGPLTMVLLKSDRVPDEISGGLPTVAVRMPSHPVARALIRLAGVPIAAPSANLSGSPSPTTGAHCIADLTGRVDVILDSGSCPVGLESTVLTLADNPPRLLRPGAVTPEQLGEVLEHLHIDDAVTRHIGSDQAVSSPGMKYKHYSPKAPIQLIHGSLPAFARFFAGVKGAGVYALVFDGEESEIPGPCITYGGVDDPASQAERLFAALRELDDAGAQQVYARAPDSVGMGLAVYNRLVRAAAFNERYLDE